MFSWFLNRTVVVLSARMRGMNVFYGNSKDFNIGNKKHVNTELSHRNKTFN